MRKLSTLIPRTGLAAASGMAAVMLSAVAVPAAAAAAASGAPRPGPDTSAVSCGSPRVWLRLQAPARQACYTGNGAIAVNLSGVYQGQIRGLHTVCLYTAGVRKVWCKTGPGEFRITPPVRVREITIRTP